MSFAFCFNRSHLPQDRARKLGINGNSQPYANSENISKSIPTCASVLYRSKCVRSRAGDLTHTGGRCSLFHGTFFVPRFSGMIFGNALTLSKRFMLGFAHLRDLKWKVN
ncbi:hypothetical protein CEXT_776021 [Caerostris extrusa]|uniref:Uncharacterized protein n=1 Tax=Caerostris extrusa TaxID=172846 RepID=A0AAV4TIE6_CAEEX|nr:hypothetical protein CEXT_776021 [Caerostris extrusa]